MNNNSSRCGRYNGLTCYFCSYHRISSSHAVYSLGIRDGKPLLSLGTCWVTLIRGFTRNAGGFLSIMAPPCCVMMLMDGIDLGAFTHVDFAILNITFLLRCYRPSLLMHLMFTNYAAH